METKQYYLSKEQWAHNKATWSKYHAKKVSGFAWHHLLVALIRNADPFVAFQPLKSPKKIAKLAEHQGKDIYHSLRRASDNLKYQLEYQRLAFSDPERWAEMGREAGKIPLHYIAYGMVKEDLYFNVTLEYVNALVDKNDAIYWEIENRLK